MHSSVKGATYSVRDSSNATLKKNALMPNPTHRYVKNPTMGVRYLADYMAGSKRKERSILQASKYRSLAKMLHHTEAKSTVSKFIRTDGVGADWLLEEADRLRRRLADDDFDRHLYDSNADYLSRFATVTDGIIWPKATVLAPGKSGWINLHGVKVTVELAFRLRRTTKTNQVREGAAMLRYAKGKAVDPEAAAWQSAFLLGYLLETSADHAVVPEGKLCLTVDAYAGALHAAPTDAVSRYQNMKAACASIAEQWPNIKAPSGAILDA